MGGLSKGSTVASNIDGRKGLSRPLRYEAYELVIMLASYVESQRRVCLLALHFVWLICTAYLNNLS
jgi:hypothetical protein